MREIIVIFLIFVVIFLAFKQNELLNKTEKLQYQMQKTGLTNGE